MEDLVPLPPMVTTEKLQKQVVLAEDAEQNVAWLSHSHKKIIRDKIVMTSIWPLKHTETFLGQNWNWMLADSNPKIRYSILQYTKTPTAPLTIPQYSHVVLNRGVLVPRCSFHKVVVVNSKTQSTKG